MMSYLVIFQGTINSVAFFKITIENPVTRCSSFFHRELIEKCLRELIKSLEPKFSNYIFDIIQ